MNNLDILDLDFFQVVTEEDAQVTGGAPTTISSTTPVSSFKLDRIKSFVGSKDLGPIKKTRIFSSPSSEIFALESSELTGYEVVADNANTLVLKGGDGNSKVSVAFSSVSTPGIE
jgi:hypothetical protein